MLREKVAEVLERVGFDPHSHAGKALMDILETYPRDELFQTPVDELVPIAEAVLHTRERRQLRLFLRRDAYGRFLSCLVYLPRDRYNTTRPRADRRRSSGAARRRARRLHRARQRVVLARLHFVVRPRQGEHDRATSTSPTSSAGWPRPPAPGATTSPPP